MTRGAARQATCTRSVALLVAGSIPSIFPQHTKFPSSNAQEVLVVLGERWNDSQSTWRNHYKALTLYEYMLKHGSESLVQELCSSRREISRLTSYEYIDSRQKDQGINVRARAQAILQLLESDNALAHAREEAKAQGQKFQELRGNSDVVQHDKSHAIYSRQEAQLESPSTVTEQQGACAHGNLPNQTKSPTSVEKSLLDFDAKPVESSLMSTVDDEQDFDCFQSAQTASSATSEATHLKDTAHPIAVSSSDDLEPSASASHASCIRPTQEEKANPNSLMAMLKDYDELVKL